MGQVTAHTKLDRVNLFLWQHLDINSDILLSVVTLSSEEIISFFVRHKSHLLNMFEYAEVLFNICKSIWKALLARFSCQMYFNSSIFFAYFSHHESLFEWCLCQTYMYIHFFVVASSGPTIALYEMVFHSIPNTLVKWSMSID